VLLIEDNPGDADLLKEFTQDDPFRPIAISSAATLAEAIRLCDREEFEIILVDLNNKNLTGKQAEEALDQAGITVNKNTVPFETRSPFVTSGIRIGTPAMTTRGMKAAEMRLIAEMMIGVMEHIDDAAYIEKIRKQVRDLCEQFPFHMELTNKY